MVLRKDLPSPLAPESDEEKEVAEAKAESDGVKKPGLEVPAVKIDFENIGQRIVALPLPQRDYVELHPGKEGVLFIVEGPVVAPLNGGGTETAHRFDLENS